VKIVNVELGERSYPIYVQAGALDQLASRLVEHKLEQRLFIITDENVRSLYGDKVLEQLTVAGLNVAMIVIPAGERSKSVKHANEIYTQLLEARADRHSVIVALGGGVVGDLAGFVAATFMRGVHFVQVPTTILAQVDSSVGGKVGVNHALGKNLIGAFHQPKFVLIDPSVLTTLPRREIRAGYAEVIKYGFIEDEEFYRFFSRNIDSLFSLSDGEVLERALYTSCRIKAHVVSKDERESGLRATLNFGHTIGHAIEAVTGYAEFLHGEAVVHGMVAALFLSGQASLLAHERIQEASALLRKFNPPPLPPQVCFESLIAAMQKDKKRSAAGQLWVLLNDIGRAELSRKVTEPQIRRSVDFMLDQASSG